MGDEESIVDGKQGILVFVLPQGAQDFKAPETLANDFLFLSESKVAYAVPFPPGENQIVFTYNLPMPESSELKLPFTINYPTDYLDVMIRSDNLEVATGQLAPADPVETSTGERYIHFTGSDFPRDDIIEIRVARLSNNISLILIVFAIILAIIIIAVTVYLIKRKKAAQQRRQSNNDNELK